MFTSIRSIRSMLILGISTMIPAQAVLGQPSSQIMIAAPVQADLPARDEASTLQRPTSGTSALRTRGSNSPAVSGSPRLQAFSDLKFDRRPSAILAAWKLTESTNEPTKGTNAAEDKIAEPAIDEEMKQLQIDVTLSHWDKVKAFIETFNKSERSLAYNQLLTSLVSNKNANAPKIRIMQGDNNQELRNPQRYQEKNIFDWNDVFGIISANPDSFTKEQTEKLAGIVTSALEQGHSVESFIERLQSAHNAGDIATMDKREAARLLILSDKATSAFAFLPTIEEASRNSDADSLLLLAKCELEKGKSNGTYLEKAWSTLQAVLSLEDLSAVDEAMALTMSVELAPRIRSDLGDAWLTKSFTENPQRGMKILSTLGTIVSQGIADHPDKADLRLTNLKLQNEAVTALLNVLKTQEETEAVHQRWQTVLSLLAENWMQEAEVSYQLSTSNSLGNRLQRDRFGNTFFMDEMGGINMGANMGGHGQVVAIALKEILALAPGLAWQSFMSQSLKPQFLTLMSGLYLKANEEARAFPYIEQLSDIFPQRASEQSQEFLRVWIKNHDLNSDKNSNRRGMYMAYGFQQRADSIPLTRSQQERNISELSKWLDKFSKLPISAIDEALLLEAFTKCHSAAEVYRIEDIEEILGDVSELDESTLAQIMSTMRVNLSTLWQNPEVQVANKTKRKKEDIQAEVIRGYALAHELLEQSLKTYPNSWKLQLAKASLLHDENSYLKRIDQEPNFEEKRLQALQAFQTAAKMYQEQLDPLDPSSFDNEIYRTWFFAALGACDVSAIDESTRLAVSQPPLIKAAIESLPEPARIFNEEQFTNAFINALTAVKPTIKFRYLSTGLEIVGDQPLAYEANKVFTYYKDLVNEIQLVAKIDGSDVVGHSQPFGVFVNLRHTADIERESGGFARYLQNQNQMSFSYNYGRPNENYRDKFEANVRSALEEHFEVLSITFQPESVQSKSDPQEGWRVTPYAYLLLKPKGSQIDVIPSLALDMDFVDTSGHVVLPIESPLLPIDARPEEAPTRPYSNLKIVQTLDERQAEEGQLKLEIKTTANGLAPEIKDIFNFDFTGFEIVEIQEEPLTVSKFDTNSPNNEVLSERLCLISLVAAEGERAPETFAFSVPNSDVTTSEVVYQRFNDADLVSVESNIRLLNTYSTPNYTLWILLGLGAVLAAIATIAAMMRRPQVAETITSGFLRPDVVTPFSTIGFLRQINQSAQLKDVERSELTETLDSLEQAYFRKGGPVTINLQDIIDRWYKRVSYQG